MPRIKMLDMMLLDELFEMGGGYVLNFSDRTMSSFFASELNIDIDDPIYRKDGTSKAKRLRCFLQTVDAQEAVRVLRALWEYRQAIRAQNAVEEKVVNAEGRYLELIGRLLGKPATVVVSPPPKAGPDRTRLATLRDKLIALAHIPPHPRGTAFEGFLKDLFDAHGLKPRAAFRLVGEQIDGSFDLDNETYLLEAKWHNERIGVEQLHTFHGKVEQKAAWSRGLFVSHSGFTAEGLQAFGRGKKIICMDGLDMWTILEREIPLHEALERKIRRAAETGSPYIAIAELFN
ncbi:uncharacterized protein DUF3644 [Panacagrimonas perspica]|uniref:Uncharacterized protein DUF3644 n=1 Tax=Panacagrimonas perspica TaxID=381431 RepID=A0A4V3URY2_9GAMM|nr:restriction endonuclease [Panacagrimonas perspica]TDU24190.1 uncharacterized protein DUF3644 [Panacagrimonas perspica]THD04601.1 hypothetical protein B1810_04065 [Panacagrimonas perspica]